MNKITQALQGLRYTMERLKQIVDEFVYVVSEVFQAIRMAAKYWKSMKPRPVLYNGRKPTARRRR